MRQRKNLKISLWVTVAWALCSAPACAPKTPAEAEALYTAEQLRCVDESETPAESAACREKVRVKWGRKKDGSRR